MLLSQAERRLGLADRLAAVIPDERDASRVIHRLPDILRARIFAIARGHEDGDDLDRLRSDPTFKLACGRPPDTGTDLCSQPTVSRWENAPSLRDLIRLMRVMVDLYCASYPAPPAAVTLDIDDTVDVVHGYQQLSFFNAHFICRSRRRVAGANFPLGCSILCSADARPLVLPTLDAWRDVPLRRAVAGQLVGDHDAWWPHPPSSAACAAAAWPLACRGGFGPEHRHDAGLIHGSPQPVLHTSDVTWHLI
jgi:hypothetical protein